MDVNLEQILALEVGGSAMSRVPRAGLTALQLGAWPPATACDCLNGETGPHCWANPQLAKLRCDLIATWIRINRHRQYGFLGEAVEERGG